MEHISPQKGEAPWLYLNQRGRGVQLFFAPTDSDPRPLPDPPSASGHKRQLSEMWVQEDKRIVALCYMKACIWIGIVLLTETGRLSQSITVKNARAITIGVITAVRTTSQDGWPADMTIIIAIFIFWIPCNSSHERGKIKGPPSRIEEGHAKAS